MDPEDFLKARDELLAGLQDVAEKFASGSFSRSDALDHAREMHERLAGEPCLAQWDGNLIVVSFPVIDYRYID